VKTSLLQPATPDLAVGAIRRARKRC